MYEVVGHYGMTNDSNKVNMYESLVVAACSTPIEKWERQFEIQSDTHKTYMVIPTHKECVERDHGNKTRL